MKWFKKKTGFKVEDASSKRSLQNNKLKLCLVAPQVPLPSTPRNVRAKAISETELEVTWDPPDQPWVEISFYKIKVADVSEGINLISNMRRIIPIHDVIFDF